MMMHVKFAIIAAFIVSSFVEPAYGEDRKNIRSVIAENCIDCHRIPGFMEEKRTPQIGAPDFQEIADNSKIYTRQRLELFLREPHFPMRRFILSKSDIQNIIAFIDNLRTQVEQP